jgi:hypothetical protein
MTNPLVHRSDTLAAQIAKALRVGHPCTAAVARFLCICHSWPHTDACDRT